MVLGQRDGLDRRQRSVPRGAEAGHLLAVAGHAVPTKLYAPASPTAYQPIGQAFPLVSHVPRGAVGVPAAGRLAGWVSYGPRVTKAENEIISDPVRSHSRKSIFRTFDWVFRAIRLFRCARRRDVIELEVVSNGDLNSAH